MHPRRFRPITWMAIMAWGTPMGFFGMASLFSGKVFIVFAMMTCMAFSFVGGWVFSLIAYRWDRDVFDAYVIGMLAGLYLSLWPVSRYIL